MSKNFFITYRTAIIVASTILVILAGCNTSQKGEMQSDQLYEGFLDPPAEARPHIRWWWNGNHINGEELKRQLDVLKKAGIGGIEINPIAMPDEAVDIGTKPVTWLSEEWNHLLVLAAREAKKRGMLTDLIVGSGWPFGGEFLKEDETIQRVIVNELEAKAGTVFNQTAETLYRKAASRMNPRSHRGEASRYEIFFVRLVPEGVSSTEQIIDLTDEVRKDKRLDYKVPEGTYRLVYGMLERGHRKVMLGAPGAAGPVMNHYDRNITLAYLSRLKKISEDTGVQLSEIIRALFCDSIELAGSNWSDGFEETFFKKYNYRIEPWYPFVFYEPFDGYLPDEYAVAILDQVRRVRYDYNKLMVKVFLDNFTRVFQEFCTQNGLLCRYQAYGIPYLMGIMEGNMIPDIPESNNWIYSADMNAPEWKWNQVHGYMIWNLYTAAGGHLTGKKTIGCEAMTNVYGVFKTSLEEIKRHDDMNFITGITHSVLHGYNYSPPAAGFPGWLRYGTYFSEQNTWWPHFPLWVEYNSRLSWVFQNSQPVKQIAIIAPAGDIWAEKGLRRIPFHTEPWYAYRLWEPISQAGSSCDYITEAIVAGAEMKNGTLEYGPMEYEALVLCSVRSLEPETAKAILSFVKAGGKLALIENIPSLALGFNNKDEKVAEIFSEILRDYPAQVVIMDQPETEDDLLPFASNLLQKMKATHDVEITRPDKNVFQIRKKAGKRDIFFFVNPNREKEANIEATFPVKGKTAWVWDPETGERYKYPYENRKNQLKIQLQPLQSLLLVFDEDRLTPTGKPSFMQAGEVVLTIEGQWNAKFEHANGQKFERQFDQLTEFGPSSDGELKTFAGMVTYTKVFNSDGKGRYLQLENAHRGVTEVLLNGKSAGINWYGKPVFNIEGLLAVGENQLEIRHTTVLRNYASSLRENPTAAKWTFLQSQNYTSGTERWSEGLDFIPTGPEGPVKILW